MKLPLIWKHGSWIQLSSKLHHLGVVGHLSSARTSSWSDLGSNLVMIMAKYHRLTMKCARIAKGSGRMRLHAWITESLQQESVRCPWSTNAPQVGAMESQVEICRPGHYKEKICVSYSKYCFAAETPLPNIMHHHHLLLIFVLACSRKKIILQDALKVTWTMKFVVLLHSYSDVSKKGIHVFMAVAFLQTSQLTAEKPACGNPHRHHS